MYGRWELAALVQTASQLAIAMRDGTAPDPGTPPPDLAGRVKPGRRANRSRPDAAVRGDFGAVLRAPRPRYAPGEVVTAQFVGGYPNNDLRRGSTFLTVERSAGADWQRVADDGDWSTKFRWQRSGRTGSTVTIEWAIPADTAAGQYRLAYFGDVRGADGAIRPLTAATDPFEVAD
jgi:neutral ceramidase